MNLKDIRIRVMEREDHYRGTETAYLLSIIEQAEKALERAKDYLESGLHYGPAEAIEEALQAIRK